MSMSEMTAPALALALAVALSDVGFFGAHRKAEGEGNSKQIAHWTRRE